MKPKRVFFFFTWPNPSRRKARDAYFMQRGQTLTPYGINRRNER